MNSSARRCASRPSSTTTRPAMITSSRSAFRRLSCSTSSRRSAISSRLTSRTTLLSRSSYLRIKRGSALWSWNWTSSRVTRSSSETSSRCSPARRSFHTYHGDSSSRLDYTSLAISPPPALNWPTAMACSSLSPSTTTPTRCPKTGST